MQTRNVPATGPRYWTALSIASVFGANMGDFVSHNLHFGHARGLGPLAAIFALTLLAERRRHDQPGGNQAYYWIAIVTLRTAATNLGDLATHDLGLPYPWVIAGLAGLLAVLLTLGRGTARPDTAAVPVTDGRYWAAMLTAGTLGTVAGDYTADDLGLGVGLASILLGGAVAAMLALRGRPGWTGVASYWLTVVAIRSAGTTLGDFCAFSHGLGLGLAMSTSLTGALLVGVLSVSNRKVFFFEKKKQKTFGT
jgi:uncharacterized membrane-anchored protein